MILRKLEIERGCGTSHSVENSLWKRLWTCRKTDGRLNEWMKIFTRCILSPEPRRPIQHLVLSAGTHESLFRKVLKDDPTCSKVGGGGGGARYYAAYRRRDQQTSLHLGPPVTGQYDAHWSSNDEDGTQVPLCFTDRRHWQYFVPSCA